MKIGVIGVGRLGICLAVNLERAGFEVIAIDTSPERIQDVNQKRIDDIEPLVSQYLNDSKYLIASTDFQVLFEHSVDLIFICVQTPSLQDGSYDHRCIESCINVLIGKDQKKSELDIVINSTTMPGYCSGLADRLKKYNYKISYNPEFIAQGRIMHDQQFPDQVLIGEADKQSGDKIEHVYRTMCQNTPIFNRMGTTEAEITKLGINCFLTTKIAFANSIGDLCKTLGVQEHKVLNSIGADSRIGNSYLSYGFGFGGPCFPRDNRALNHSAENAGIQLDISRATDQANGQHLEFQFSEYLTYPEPIVFDYVTYKHGTNIIEESQRLALAVKLMKAGKRVMICDSKEVIEQVKMLHGDSFIYQVNNGL